MISEIRVICPKCQHPHLVKRIVIPYGNLKNKESAKKTSEKNPNKLTQKEKNNKSDTFIKKIINRVNFTNHDKTEEEQLNPLIENLERGITSNQAETEDENEIQKAHAQFTVHNDFKKTPQSELIKLETYSSPAKEKEESIVSYSDIQKLGSRTVIPEAPPKQLSAFFVTTIIGLSFLVLISFMIYAIYQKYSNQ